MNQYFSSVKNCESQTLKSIPVLDYKTFYSEVLNLLNKDENHCVNYYAYPVGKKGLKFICIIADDLSNFLYVVSHELGDASNVILDSLTNKHYALHIFEREISENYGIIFKDHPWPKPVRFPSDRSNQNLKVNDYPFYSIESDELHEVGVGPIHAGVIEPGHFRFICNGEMVLHLEIQLGWQHKGIEKLFLEKSALLQRCLLSESIAGDTAIGHATAFVQTIESLGKIIVSKRTIAERAIGLELERIGVHVGDISALCTDVAYQLGTNVFGALRTPIINFLQSWCGNRFGKGLIRVGGSNYPLDAALLKKLEDVLNNFEWRFKEMADLAYPLPSVEDRFDEIGAVTNTQARLLGTVGMAARMSGVNRDIRHSHPFGVYQDLKYEPVLLEKGDVYARFYLRKLEIERSINYIREIMKNFDSDLPKDNPAKESELNLEKSALSVSLTEGWRGEICHCAITDEHGRIIHYKIKDPSMHNWKALELSLRNLEISDFPINNKSYNLSYCGHDL